MSNVIKSGLSQQGRTCFVGMCNKPDVNAPDEGTWPTCSKYPPACIDHLAFVPPPQRRDRNIKYSTDFGCDQRCWTLSEVMRCSYCGSLYHTVALCQKTWRGSARRLTLYCSYCGANDHDIKACPKTWSGNANRAWHEDSVADHFVKDK